MKSVQTLVNRISESAKSYLDPFDALAFDPPFYEIGGIRSSPA